MTAPSSPIADKYDGKKLNSPTTWCEVGGSIWFTDPPYAS